MKMPTEWHKKNLENMRRFAQRQRDTAREAVDAAERVERDCIALDAQIIKAELKGIEEFDADKFNVKRKPSSAAPQGKIKEE